MPFKTRRAKISAATRRFTFVDTQVVDYSEKGARVGIERGVDLSNVKQGAGGRTIENNYDYVKGDLFKTILLTSIIILAQIALFFFLKHS